MAFVLLALVVLLAESAQGSVECYRGENGVLTRCTTERSCVIIVSVVDIYTDPTLTHHCLSPNLSFCVTIRTQPEGLLHQFSGCCRENLCNQFVSNTSLASLSEYVQYLEERAALTGPTPTTTSASANNTVVIAIVVPILAFIPMAIAAGFIVLIFVFLVRRKKRPRAAQVEDINSKELEMSSGRGNGHLLECKTISQEIKMNVQIGRGRYGEVWLGRWRDKDVAVKKFAFCDKESWKREREIYETSMLRNDYILTYLAADMYEHGYSTCIEMWMVTDFHPHGSLFDYLNQHSLSEYEMITFARTTASGLSFLHTELRTRDSLKPCIAHRDIKSRNILVKSDMSCCIADFGLAVRHDTVKNMIDIAPNSKQGTKRYMSPEVLDETIDIDNFASFKQSDMYSFGLVLWEMLRRCAVNGECMDYQLPYYDKVPGDPSIKEMKNLVVDQQYRPELRSLWLDCSEACSTMTSVIAECWHPVPEARLSAKRVAKNLGSVAVKETSHL